MVAKSLENYLSKARDDIELARNKKNAKSPKPANAKSTSAAEMSGANSTISKKTDTSNMMRIPNELIPHPPQMMMPQ